MTTTSPADLEARLGLIKMAGALVTDDRPAALAVGLGIGALPVAPVPDDLAAAALEAMASLATVMAAELRGDQPLQ